MVRQTLRRFITVMTIVVALEALALGAVPFVVPDLMARVLRLVVPDPQPVPPSATARPDRTFARPLVIEDSFDTPSELWDQSDIAVRDGHLALQVVLPHADTYAIFLGVPTRSDTGETVLSGSFPVDVTLEARMLQLSGSDDAAYGIRIRQSTPDTYIAVQISPRGYWRVQRSVAGTLTDLQPWTASHTIEHGIGYANTLRVSAQGTALTIAINDVVVGRLTDDAPSAGQLALAAQTTASGGLRVDVQRVSGSIGTAMFAEDFSDESSHTFSIGGSLTTDGVYRMRSGAGVSAWQTPLPRQNTTAASYTLRVDMRLVQGNPATVGYGVVLGDTGDFAHTVLLFRPDGTLHIMQTNSGAPARRVVDPILIPFFDTTLGATNQIELRVDAAGVNVSVNGQAVGSVDNLRIPVGSVGMLLMSGDRPAEVAFDNFSLIELPQ